jgi:predicted 2-oxoglutarate/Fe(II)-dependent dioxygenase YbiX
LVHIDNHYRFEYLTNSTIIYLNDDYEGGEIYFPEFDFEYKPKRGDAILFPCDKNEFRHGVKEVTKGKRMTIAMWHCPLKEKEHPLLS